jgi:predicted Zn-dependent peptidase
VAGQVLPGRDNADATAIEAVAALLGDFSFSSGSRVYNAFRMERGLSYSPRVELGARPAPEPLPLFATLPVAPGVVDTAVTTLLKVFRDLRKEKPGTAAELDFAKRALTGRVASDLERVDGLASLVLVTMRDGLPADFMNRWVKNINNVTLPEVEAAAAKYLDPDHMAIVVIADKSRVEAALRGTGIPVVIVP